jgi:hypothetical protein
MADLLLWLGKMRLILLLVDSAWEQKKFEARKLLENAAESQRPVHAAVLGVLR